MLYVNKKRIEWCCDKYHLSIEDLAKAVNISAKTLNAPDANYKLSYKQLKKIEKHFGYNFSFFLEKTLPKEENIHTPQFRTITNQLPTIDLKTQKVIRNAEKHRNIYIGLLEDLGEISVFQKPNLQGCKTLKEKALKVREWLGIEEQGTFDFLDYREAISNKGIMIVLSSGYFGAWKLLEDNILGSFLSHEQVPLILIKKTSEKRQVFTLFHELAHLLLGKESRVNDGNDVLAEPTEEIEIQANQFAGLCLLPDGKLPKRIPENMEDYESKFKTLSDNLKISVDVIVRRLLNENKLSRAKFQNYVSHRKEQPPPKKQSGGIRHRHIEPLKIFGSNYACAVVNAFYADHIPLSKACAYLDNIRIKYFRALQGEL